MVKINATGLTGEDDLAGDFALPGKYHVVIAGVDETFQESDSIVIDFEVHAGTTPGQEGKQIREYFAVTPKAVKRLQRLALVTGLIAPGSPEVDIQFVAARGRQLIIEAIEDVYEKDGQTKKRTALSFMGMWSVGNAAVNDVPKNQRTLSLISGNVTAPAMPAAAPQPQPQPQPQPVAGGLPAPNVPAGQPGYYPPPQGQPAPPQGQPSAGQVPPQTAPPQGQPPASGDKWDEL